MPLEMQDEQNDLRWRITIEPTAAPVQHILKAAACSLYRIAPERRSELLKRCTGLSLTISDENRFLCEAYPSWPVVRVSRRVVELVWAFSYAYWDIYQVAFSGRQIDGSPIDLHSFPKLEPALRLLRWAHNNLVGKDESDWPADLPRPYPGSPMDSTERVADELALCGIAMYLHHELAHVYAPRNPELSETDEERFCDTSAAQWILGAATLDAAVLQKRALGVAIGMVMLVVRSLSNGHMSDGVHPAGHARLVDVLAERVPKEQQAVWGFVLIALALHVGDAGLPPHQEFYDDFRDAALGYCAHIQRHTDGGTPKAV